MRQAGSDGQVAGQPAPGWRRAIAEFMAESQLGCGLLPTEPREADVLTARPARRIYAVVPTRARPRQHTPPNVGATP